MASINIIPLCKCIMFIENKAKVNALAPEEPPGISKNQESKVRRLQWGQKI